ncbi:hypothetical protein FALBO_1231 [Fusarium albosuccineum]|uniref:Uncharacterized protein n=1 Tax=Fusarium albosuccineum TaxID=1237068 RepID=A0A8H4PM29_9HYPO|nr:hypothetical protein FALBO_1231 [Fusarium albosuccineum]
MIYSLDDPRLLHMAEARRQGPRVQTQHATLYIIIQRPAPSSRYLWSFSIFDDVSGTWRTFGAQTVNPGEPCKLKARNGDPGQDGMGYIPLSRILSEWVPEVYERCRLIGVSEEIDEVESSQRYVRDLCSHLLEEGIIEDFEFESVFSKLDRFDCPAESNYEEPPNPWARTTR